MQNYHNLINKEDNKLYLGQNNIKTKKSDFKKSQIYKIFEK